MAKPTSKRPKKSAQKKKAAPPSELKGWHQITTFLGQPITVVLRWAKNGMPVRREGRHVVATPDDLNKWLGREAGGEPLQVATPDTDLSAELKRGLAYVRGQKRER